MSGSQTQPVIATTATKKARVDTRALSSVQLTYPIL